MEHAGLFQICRTGVVAATPVWRIDRQAMRLALVNAAAPRISKGNSSAVSEDRPPGQQASQCQAVTLPTTSRTTLVLVVLLLGAKAGVLTAEPASIWPVSSPPSSITTLP